MTNDNLHLQSGAELQNGKYRIERVLGQGGFGMVYLADDTFLKRKVAIKEFFLKPYCSRSDSDGTIVTTGQASGEIVGKMKAKFLKEARHIARFNHPGIIKIHDAFEENGTAYYVMDFIEGESLQEMVKRNDPLNQKKAVEYISKVGDAIQYIHDRHVNHLDVKPSNILVRAEDDQPILIDFGLSKQYDSSGEQTSTTPVGISHGYAPIEQYVEGGIREFSPQTDVYSLAATLYYLLEGVKPLTASQLLNEPIQFNNTSEDGLKETIKLCMTPNREDRLINIKELKNKIKGCLSNVELKINIEKNICPYSIINKRKTTVSFNFYDLLGSISAGVLTRIFEFLLLIVSSFYTAKFLSRHFYSLILNALSVTEEIFSFGILDFIEEIFPGICAILWFYGKYKITKLDYSGLKLCNISILLYGLFFLYLVCNVLTFEKFDVIIFIINGIQFLYILFFSFYFLRLKPNVMLRKNISIDYEFPASAIITIYIIIMLFCYLSPLTP